MIGEQSKAARMPMQQAAVSLKDSVPGKLTVMPYWAG